MGSHSLWTGSRQPGGTTWGSIERLSHARRREIRSRRHSHKSALNEPGQDAVLKEIAMAIGSLLTVLASTFIVDATRANRSDGEMARAVAKLARGSPTVQW